MINDNNTHDWSDGSTRRVFELVGDGGALNSASSLAAGSILSTWADQALREQLIEPMHLRRGLVGGSRVPTAPGICGLSVLPEGFRIDAVWVNAMAVCQAQGAEAWTLACADSCRGDGGRSVWILVGCQGFGRFGARARFDVADQAATFLDWEIEPRRL